MSVSALSGGDSTIIFMGNKMKTVIQVPQSAIKAVSYAMAVAAPVAVASTGE